MQVDGEQLALNEELGSTISSIVNSYIKQKISGIKKTISKPSKNPNKGPRSPHITPEQKQLLIARAQELEDKTFSEAMKILSAEFNRKVATVSHTVNKARKQGLVSFQPTIQSEVQKEVQKKAFEKKVETMPDSLRGMFQKK